MTQVGPRFWPLVENKKCNPILKLYKTQPLKKTGTFKGASSIICQDYTKVNCELRKKICQ